jgi:hypothetical protein
VSYQAVLTNSDIPIITYFSHQNLCTCHIPLCCQNFTIIQTQNLCYRNPTKSLTSLCCRNGTIIPTIQNLFTTWLTHTMMVLCSFSPSCIACDQQESYHTHLSHSLIHHMPPSPLSSSKSSPPPWLLVPSNSISLVACAFAFCAVVAQTFEQLPSIFHPSTFN